MYNCEDPLRKQYFKEASIRLIARLLEKLKEYANTEGGGDDFVIYDEVSNDISTQKGIFFYPCIPYLSIETFHKKPEKKFLNIGVALHDYDVINYGSIFICTIDEMIAKLEKNIYTSLFASLFQDSYNRLEDRILEWKY